MEIKLLITAAAFCLCFLSAFALLQTAFTRRLADSFIPLYFPLSAALIVLYFALPSFHDALFPVPLAEIISVVICAGLLFILGSRPALGRYSFLLTLLAAETSLLFADYDEPLLSDSLPLWLDSILAILLWGLFSWSFHFLSALNGLLSRQSLTIALGIGLLYPLGGSPFFLSMVAIGFVGVFLAWSLYESFPAKILLSPAGGCAIGFILCWLMLKSTAEGSGPCVLCFSMFFIYQICLGAIKKFSPRPQYRNLIANTDYFQAYQQGLSAPEICSAISKLFTLQIILGCFEVFAPNSYSVPLLVLITTAWFSYRLGHWQDHLTPQQTSGGTPL